MSHWICWTPLDANWFKLNTNGAFKHNTGMASAGGLIRDAKGD